MIQRGNFRHHQPPGWVKLYSVENNGYPHGGRMQRLAVRQHRPKAVWGGRTERNGVESLYYESQDSAVFFASTFVALAQPNPVTEFRMIGNVKYDVSQPPFIAVTIS